MKTIRRCILLAALAAAWSAVPARAVSRTMRNAYVYGKLEAQQCLENQLKLYRCLCAYAAKHDGMLPAGSNVEGLRQLVPYGADQAMFQCAASRAKRIKKNAELREENNPFLYFGGMNLDTMRKTAPNVPLLADKPGSRHLNIVYIDGRTETVDADKLSRKVSSCRQFIQVLHARYNYPADVLAALLRQADAADAADAAAAKR